VEALAASLAAVYASLRGATGAVPAGVWVE